MGRPRGAVNACRDASIGALPPRPEARYGEPMPRDDRQLALPFAAAKAAVAVVEPGPPRVAPPATPPAPPRRRSRSKLLAEALQATLGDDIKLVITDNRTSLLSQSRKEGDRVVRVHQMFLDAPDEVRAALAEYAAHGTKRAGLLVDAFIEENDHLLSGPLDLPPDAHLGKHHDLLPMFHVLNARYFADQIAADLTWGNDGAFRGRSRTSITLGSYDYRAKRITIHPVLDQGDVPEMCVARILHHEMCHAAHPAEETPGGRRIVHTRSFRAAEALFEGAAEADAWLDDNLDRLLAFKKGKKAARKARRA